MLARIFNSVPRKARPALLLVWLIVMCLIGGQAVAFGLRAAHASGKTFDGAIDEMYSAGVVCMVLAAILASMIMLLLRWCWHWSDRHEKAQARRARDEIHLVEH